MDQRSSSGQDKVLGRKRLEEVGTLFTPDTILRWHRQLVAQKWNHADRRSPGRPCIRQVIVDLILRLARENPSWGYDRIQGALANVGYHVSDRTVGNVLKHHGIEPAPERKRQTSWRTFLKAHWDVLASCSRLVTSVRKLFTIYVDQHNRLLPHSAFHGQTPDEMYFGTGADVPKQLETARIEARRARMDANRSPTCGTCDELVSVIT